jgi:predicted molibdopterin-dependent oxidoreductase YjgC
VLRGRARLARAPIQVNLTECLLSDIAENAVYSSYQLTFHFHETPTNEITSSHLDPVAKIPETKVVAVRLEKIG